MSINISTVGISARLVASKTFQSGFDISEFADDADPLDSPDLAVADTGFATNGTMVIWSRPAGIEMALNVIPMSEAAVNLSILLEANRVGKGKVSAQDKCTLVWTYPQGLIVTGNNGAIISGPIMPGAATSGRMKTQRFLFRFENVTKTNQTQPLSL
jgi:hypothetical protein